MGANQFQNKQSARTAEGAFRTLVDKALYEDGHGGYTGTIAEKSSFRIVLPRQGESAADCMCRCMEDPNHWSGDKHEPAACIDGGPDPKQPGLQIFYFFGWASS
jgi:hypothetical protein